MKEWVREWLDRKKKYRHKLKQNIQKLQLPMDNYWPDIIGMSIKECRAELAEVEGDIRYLESSNWDNLNEVKKDDGEGKRETRTAQKVPLERLGGGFGL